MCGTSPAGHPLETAPSLRPRSLLGMDRRTFLRLAGMAAATPPVGALLAACGNPPAESTSLGAQTRGTTATTAADTSGTTLVRRTNRTVNPGLTPLPDCPPLAMAQDAGTDDAPRPGRGCAAAATDR